MSANGPPGVPKSLNEQYSWVQNTHLFRIAAEIKKLKETVKCGICHSTIQDHILTSCNHMFCAGCFKEFQKKTTSDRKNSCPVCAQKLNRRTFGSSEMVSTLIENYLKLAKHITGELFAFDIPADMRFFESQAVMTQMPLPRRSDPLPSPHVMESVFKAPAFSSTSGLGSSQAVSSQMPPPLSRKLPVPKLARQAGSTNLFRRPNAAWKLQNASQAIVEEEEEEVKQHDDATTGSEDDRHDGTPSLGHEASLLEPIRAEVQVTAKKDGSVQAVAETKATEVQAAKSMRDSFAQATQFTKESSTQTTTEKYDQQIEGSSAELFGKVDVMELITQMKQVHQCDTMQAVTQLFPGLIAMLNNDGYLVAKPHEFHPLAEASLSYMTTQPLYGNPLYTVADNAQMSHSFLAFPPHAPVPGAQAPHGAENGERSPTDEGTLNLDDTYPMEMSDHPSLRPPIKISKDFGDSTLQNLEEEIPLDISVFTEGTKTHPGGHQITSTPLLPHVKALKGTESETPGVSPISRPNKSKRPKRNATRNLSSIMEMDEVDKQVSPVILKLQRGSSVTRDPGTQKVNWENCEFRVAGQSLEVIKEKSHCEPNPAENMAEPANDDYETVPDSSQGDEDQPLDEEVDCVEDSFRDVDAGETEELFDADKENFQPDKVNKIAILVVGKNTLNDAQFLARFSVAFPDVEVAENCSRNVTHIIIFDSDGRTNVNLSIHYVYALSHRIPAVTQQWLKDSIKEKRILDTRNYEIEEIRGMKGSIGAGRRSAEDRKRTLFRKFWFHVPEFVYESDNVSRGMLLEMIEACGGNIVEKPWDAKGARGCKLMIPGNIMSEYLREDALKYEATTNYRVILSDWIIDSICRYEVVPKRMDIFRVSKREEKRS